ncbi:MAG TPA: serine/threonine-protein kinase [Polyangia bacterium]|jgi:tetratricopeptide (TPR) repeat protein|nr:serine/threonine-protein kinase [Polyangia bacterium]
MRQSDFELSSAPVAEPLPVLTRGTALGRFVVLGLVGRGAMGEVYGAYDPELDRKIAIKLLRPRAVSSGDGADNRTRLMREAQATAKISHPNVVVVYDAGTFGDRVFIAMEFIEGHTLRFWLQVQPRTWHEILDAFLAAGRGLAAAHDKALVHRDFKPDNVMVTAPGGQVRVMDFGLARMALEDAVDAPPEPDFDSTMELNSGLSLPVPHGSTATPTTVFRDKITATGAVLGTPAYMSPEQFRSLPADARSDQFSFCVALYEALYGQRPFAGRSLQELGDNVVAGRLAERRAAHGVPAWLLEVLGRGLKADPAARFPSMNELLAELDRRAGTGRKGFATGAAAKLAGVWEAPVGGYPVPTPEKERMREAFLATGKPYAAAVFVAASALLDRYAQRWTELYVEVCEATHVRGDQSAEVLDLRMACLDEGLDDLKALCRLFREPTGEVVENAVKATNALGNLERCQDIKLLRAVLRLPDDPAERSAVETFRARLVESRALSRVGRAVDGLAAVTPIVDEARRLGHAPTLAEVLLLFAKLQNEVSMEPSIQLEEALFIAEECRHEEVAAEAAALLVYFAGAVKTRFDVGEIWSRHTEAILRRIGGHDLMWALYYDSRGGMRQQQGRLREAIEDSRLAVAAKERVLGPDAVEVGVSLTNLANHMAYGANFVEALAVNQRAFEILAKELGAAHPRTTITTTNQAQFLFRIGKFDEAIELARGALAVFERETDPSGLVVTYPMRTLGNCYLRTGRAREAVTVLERALVIREGNHMPAIRLAEIRSPLARALFDLGRDPTSALALARQALADLTQAASTPVVALDRAELEQWLRAHEPSASVRGRRRVVKKKKTSPPPNPSRATPARRRRRTRKA